MNLQILAERKAWALMKIQQVSGALAEKFSIPEALIERLTQTSKDKEVEAMQRLEAVADLLTFMVEQKGEPEIPFILDLNVKQIGDAIEKMDSEAILKELLKDEQNGKARKTVISAIESRLKVLDEG